MDDRPVAWNIAKCEIVVDGACVYGGAPCAMAKQCLHLRGKQETARQRQVIERLDTDAVPRQKQRPGGAIIDGERKHPIQCSEGVCTVGLIGVQQDLRVRSRLKSVSVLLKRGTDLAIIVDLSIEHQDQ